MDKKTAKIKDKQSVSNLRRNKDWKKILENLGAPHVTEKATSQEGLSKYIFKVTKRANKISIKKAVSVLYGKKVKKIAIINIKRKPMRKGKKIGYKPGYKKAIVTLEKGEKLDLFAKK
jgi:large subunit ribosomal protein L23